MKRCYRLRRNHLSQIERSILSRLTCGLEPFARAPRDPGVFAKRNGALRYLEHAGYIALRDGKWTLTPEAREFGRRIDEYTEAQDAVIRQIYQEVGPSILAERFGRSVPSVVQRAIKIGAARKWISRDWTAEYDEAVRERYAIEGPRALALALNRTPSAVSSRAHKLRAVRVGRDKPSLEHPWRRGL